MQGECLTHLKHVVAVLLFVGSSSGVDVHCMDNSVALAVMLRGPHPCDCKQGGEKRKSNIRDCAAVFELGREGRQKGVLLDISAAPRSPSVERVLAVYGALIAPAEGSEGEGEGGKSENNNEAVRIWGGQEVAGSWESVGSVEEEESYEAQRDRQVAKVRKRFQLLLQHKSNM